MRIIILFIMLSSCIFMQKKDPNFFSSDNIYKITKLYRPMLRHDSLAINEISNYDKLIVHYFNGECSICIGGMISLYKFYNKHNVINSELLFIVDTADTIVFNFYRERDVPEALVLHDENLLFEKAFPEVKNGNNITYVFDNNGKLIIKGDFANDDKFQAKLLDELDQYKAFN